MEVILTFGPDIFDVVPDHFHIRDLLMEGQAVIAQFH